MKIYYNPALKGLARELRNNMTFAEKATWRMLNGKQFNGYDFHRQKPIGEFIADFYCYDLRLVIEIDGITHLDEDVIRKDRIKSQYFTSIGLNILRFSDDLVLGNWMMVEKELIQYIKDFENATHP